MHVPLVVVDGVRLAVQLAGHHRDLVVGVERRVRVGPGPRVGIGVEERSLRTALILRPRDGEHRALVDLYRDLTATCRR